MIVPDFNLPPLPWWKRLWHRILRLFGINPYRTRFRRIQSPLVKNNEKAFDCDLRQIMASSACKDETDAQASTS